MMGWRVGALGGLALAVGCGSSPCEAGLEVGQCPPDFELPDHQGQSVSLSSLRGAPVVLEVAASWCARCQDLAVGLVRVGHEVPSVQPVGLLIEDLQGERPDVEDAARWVTGLGLDYAVLADESWAVRRAWEPRLVPQTWLIDAEGVTRWQRKGAGPDAVDDLLDAIGKL